MADAASAVKAKTTAEILGESIAHDLLQDIFADLHPALLDETRDLSSIFTPQSAGEFLSQLTNFEALLSDVDSYEQTVQKLQSQIDGAEKMRDDLLAQVLATAAVFQVTLVLHVYQVFWTTGKFECTVPDISILRGSGIGGHWPGAV